MLTYESLDSQTSSVFMKVLNKNYERDRYSWVHPLDLPSVIELFKQLLITGKKCNSSSEKISQEYLEP